MIEKFLNKYGTNLILILFGIFAIFVSLYEAIYSEYGDLVGLALRQDPVWWVFGFGVFVIFAGFLSKD